MPNRITLDPWYNSEPKLRAYARQQRADDAAARAEEDRARLERVRVADITDERDRLRATERTRGERTDHLARENARLTALVARMRADAAKATRSH